MPKKRSKKSAGKKTRPVGKRTVSSKAKNLKRSTKRKINLVFKNLILFVILFIASVILYTASKGGVYGDLFFLISFILGAISGAFLIILLILLFMRGMKK